MTAFPLMMTVLALAAGAAAVINCTGKSGATFAGRVDAPTAPLEIDAAPVDVTTLRLNPVMPTSNQIKYIYKSNGDTKVFAAPTPWRMSFNTDSSGALTVATFIDVDNTELDDAITPNGRPADTSAGAITPVYQFLQYLVPAGTTLAVNTTWAAAPPTSAQLQAWAQSTATVMVQDRDYQLVAAWAVGDYTIMRVSSVIYRFVGDTLGLRNAQANLGDDPDPAEVQALKPGRAAIEGFGIADVVYGSPGSGFEGGLPLRIADSYLASEVPVGTPASQYSIAPLESLETMCIAAVVGPDPGLDSLPIGIPKPAPDSFITACTLQ